ncbi:hypothetical protein Syun_016710 [Stephania yunnanensis]|uniref:Uncharacterized protein n=1 Tax=Stephania yunnanensis TaxID=152371 RepID=A0AAP0P2F2_9MAGN
MRYTSQEKYPITDEEVADPDLIDSIKDVGTTTVLQPGASVFNTAPRVGSKNHICADDYALP